MHPCRRQCRLHLRRLDSKRTPMLPDMGVVLVAKILQRAENRRDRSVAECAHRSPRDVWAQAQHCIDVLWVAETMLNAFEDLQQPGGSLPAGRTLPAGLMI